MPKTSSKTRKTSQKTPKKAGAKKSAVKSTKKTTQKTTKTAVKVKVKEISLKDQWKKKVPDDKVFFLIDGTTIANLLELVDAFERMSDDVFYYHVTPERNDFANWVRDVIKEEALADQLLQAQNPLRAELIVLKYIFHW